MVLSKTLCIPAVNIVWKADRILCLQLWYLNSIKFTKCREEIVETNQQGAVRSFELETFHPNASLEEHDAHLRIWNLFYLVEDRLAYDCILYAC